LPEFDHAEPLRRRSRIKSGMTLALGDNDGKARLRRGRLRDRDDY